MGKKSRLKRERRESGSEDKAAPTKPGRDPGARVVDDLFARLYVDEQWSVREDRGFTWWAHRLAQRVWAEPASEDRGETVSRVFIETDLAEGAPDDPKVEQLVSIANAMTALYAMRVDRSSGRVVLTSSALVHGGNAAWMPRLLSMAALLQLLKAEGSAEPFEAATGAKVAASEHPSGVREEPDDMLNSAGLFVQAGQKQPFTGDDLKRLRKMDRMSSPWPTWNISGDAAVARMGVDGVPGEVSLLLTLEAPHPDLGNGVLQLLQLPALAEPDRAPEFAAALNAEEVRWGSLAHLLGAWTADPNSEGLTFASFLPALTVEGQPADARRALLFNLAVTYAARAKWVPEVLPSVRFAEAA
jgi:hypothetical protein